MAICHLLILKSTKTGDCNVVMYILSYNILCYIRQAEQLALHGVGQELSDNRQINIHIPQEGLVSGHHLQGQTRARQIFLFP